MVVLPRNFISNVASGKEILSTAVSSGFIRGVKFGSPELTISHLFYVDDVIITTEWNANDLDNIIRVLQVFYLASGLKINIQKSNIYGIGVSDVDVSSMASNSRCALGSFPFTYLRLPIGSNMSLTSSWQVLLDRFQSKLSSWKANLLSIGGRHTLIKVVLGSLGIYYFSIFKVPEYVLNSLERSRAIFFGEFTRTRYGLKLSKLYMVRLVALIAMVVSRTDARCIIDSNILPSLAPSTVLDKNIPRKAITYPPCNGNVKSSNHIFFECNIANYIWMLVYKWCDISFPPFTSYEHWKGWFSS
ncbi:hypothetical protein Tco_1298275 [Tanacetum coccineum]